MSRVISLTTNRMSETHAFDGDSNGINGEEDPHNRFMERIGKGAFRKSNRLLPPLRRPVHFICSRSTKDTHPFLMKSSVLHEGHSSIPRSNRLEMVETEKAVPQHVDK